MQCCIFRTVGARRVFTFSLARVEWTMHGVKLCFSLADSHPSKELFLVWAEKLFSASKASHFFGLISRNLSAQQVSVTLKMFLTTQVAPPLVGQNWVLCFWKWKWKSKSILDGIVILNWWDTVTDYISGSHWNVGGNSLKIFSGTGGRNSKFCESSVAVLTLVPTQKLSFS